MLEEKPEVNVAETPADTQPANPVVDENKPQENPVEPTGEQQQVAKPVLSPEQKEYVKDLIRARVERSHNRFFERYGVADLKGLDELFDKSKKFDEISAQLEKLTGENAVLTEQLSFIKNNINPDKYDDIRRYFKGGDVQFSEASLLEALPTHPEWIKSIPQNPTAKTTIQSLSPTRGHTIEETDDEKMKRVFGV